MADELTARKLKSINLMMQMPLSPSARNVGWYLYERLNALTLRAWPSQTTIGDFLRLDLKTVKRAIAELRELGIIQIIRVDRRNEYVLALVASVHDECLQLSHQFGPRPKGAKPGHNKGQKRTVAPPSKGDNNGPLYPLPRIHSSKPLGREPIDRRASRDVGWHSGDQPFERLREQRGDEIVEREVVELLNAHGCDGLETLSALHKIDDGQPRLRLFKLYRNDALAERDLAAAVLIARAHGGAGQKSTRGRVDTGGPPSNAKYRK